jgi:uncharacterized protein (TIGR00725 family)
VGIMGAGEPSESNLAYARRLGTLAAQRGWIVLTGGRPAGVMAAACAGAKLVPGSLTLGILPGVAGAVAPGVDVAVFTGMGDARNAINVLTSDVVVACGVEGPGTASEVALALKAGKPVVLVDASRSSGNFFSGLRQCGRLYQVSEPLEAIELIETKLGFPRSTWA